MAGRLEGKRVILTDPGYYSGPFAFTPAQEGTDEEMERLMSSIFYPMHRMITAVLPQMLARRSGKIVVTSSVNAIKGRAGGATLYSAAAVPAGRLASMEEFARTALFLAGPESDFFYGQVIPFAGGWAV
ncbi:MAG: 2-keto-3-deoxy-L-fuconate dehydrogenase [Pseudonocardiales bacterium]|nr:2-keto-3-deoxy-L-fuconate dehydrogenase [Pseudonocardiales bacterium]